jgi:hypothetical protein
MAKVRHPWRLAILLLAATTAFGCNMMSLPFFLLAGMDPKHDPKCKLAAKDKEKEVKVVVLTSSHVESRPELLRSDSELNLLLSRHMERGFKTNKDNIKVVPANKVEKFKNEHPNWKRTRPEEIGRHFGADYVIDLEINELSLYEAGSGNQLFRGKCDVSVVVVQVNRPEEPYYQDTYRGLYPKTRGPIAAEDSSLPQFRQAFLNQAAKELSWWFTAHPTSDDFTLND